MKMPSHGKYGREEISRIAFPFNLTNIQLQVAMNCQKRQTNSRPGKPIKNSNMKPAIVLSRSKL